MNERPFKRPAPGAVHHSQTPKLGPRHGLFAWKISAPDRPDAEKIGSLAEEHYLDTSGLAGAAHP